MSDIYMHGVHLLLCVEGMEVVVVSELGATADVFESKKTDSVHPVHRPAGDKSVTSSIT